MHPNSSNVHPLTFNVTYELTLNNNLEFKGKEIRLKFEARSEYYLSFTQTKFIEALEVPKIKGKGEETLQPADLPDYRSVSGSLQWVSGQTRPDVAATISLCSKGSKATYKDLHWCVTLSSQISESNEERGFQRVSHDDWRKHDCGFVCWFVLGQCGRICKPAWELGPFHWCSSDRAGSSWDFGGNLADRRGFVDRRWQRKQIAADASVDRSVYQNYMLSELLQQKPAFQISTENLLRSLHVTDCKSLYDCISAMNPNTSEKRVIIDIRSIQQHVGRQEIHWVPTELMFCDCLTKISKALMQTFQGWLQQPWIQLRSSWFTPKKNSRVWV